MTPDTLDQWVRSDVDAPIRVCRCGITYEDWDAGRTAHADVFGHHPEPGVPTPTMRPSSTVRS